MKYGYARLTGADKGGLISLQGCVEAAQLTHELERGCADLFVGRRRIEIEQALDAAAHDQAIRLPGYRFGITPAPPVSNEPDKGHCGRCLDAISKPEYRRIAVLSKSCERSRPRPAQR
jgi:hypothetical protein